MVIDVPTLIVAAAFIYFAIGGVSAGAAAMANLGFTGRLGWEPVLIFFGWPLGLLAQLGPGLYIALGLVAAGGMTWLVWLAVSNFQ